MGEEIERPRLHPGIDREAAEARRQQHVLDRAETGEQVEILHDEPDIRRAPRIACRLGAAGEILAGPHHPAAVRPLQPRHHVDEGRLAGPGRAGDRHRLARRDREARDLQNRSGETGERNRNIVEHETGHRGHASEKEESISRTRLTNPVSGSVQEPYSSVPDTSMAALYCTKVCLRSR